MLRSPRMASWLLDLFTPYEETESIPGDLYEEFCIFAGAHGLKSARHWYWPQTWKSIDHLFVGAFRNSPWSLFAAIITGIFLLRLGVSLPERTEFAILNWGHGYHSHWYGYVARMDNAEILAGQLLVCLVVGFVVGFLAKGRELVAAMALVLITQLLFVIGLYFARVVGPPETLSSLVSVLSLLAHLSEFPIMFLFGAWMVRDIRLTRTRSRA
jgi:hypothetical protein